MNINFVKFRKFYFIFSGILILGSLASIITFGLKPGIDFTGGSILELEFKTERPSNSQIQEKLTDLNLGEFYLQPTEEKGLVLKTKEITEKTHQEILERLGYPQELNELRLESIGPVIGRELKQKTKIVVVLSLFVILFYIAFSFRRIQRPISSWQYGLVSLLVLFHDLLIPLGIFSILGKFFGVQITIPVITAFLTVVGYAINNVVVVYDRIRENLLKFGKLDFSQTVDQSINQTLTRQINTSLTTLFPLFFIFFLGGETLKYFALALILGIIAGTYSSIFLASPILVSWLNWRKKENRRRL